jgi:hypothetical protein
VRRAGKAVEDRELSMELRIVEIPRDLVLGLRDLFPDLAFFL